jgi:hypothetical protein
MMRSSPNSSKTTAYRKAPPYRPTSSPSGKHAHHFAMLRATLFERFAIGSFIFVAAFSIFIRY